MKKLAILMLAAISSHVSLANEPCEIIRQDSGGEIEPKQLVNILREDLLSYYDACESKPKESKSLKKAAIALHREKPDQTDVAEFPDGAYDYGAVKLNLDRVIEQMKDEGVGPFPYKAEMTRFASNWFHEVSLPSVTSPESIAPFDSWTSNTELVFGPYDFGAYIEANGCNAVNIDDEDLYSNHCEPTVNQTLTAFNYIGALAETAKLGQIPAMKKFQVQLETMDNRWETYFDNTRSLYAWEVVINTSIHNRSRRGEDGFNPVPDRQLFVMHPSLAYEYVDDEEGGNKFEETLVMEIIGYNKWGWKGDTAATGMAFGASIIAAYSDRANVDDLGWGVMVHVNHKYSFGVTRRGSATGYFLSVDLQKAFLKFNDAQKSSFSEFGWLEKVLGR